MTIEGERVYRATGWRKAVLVASGVVGGIMLLISLPMILTSGMMFDAPRSGDNIILWFMVAGHLLAPVFAWFTIHNASKGCKDYVSDRLLAAVGLPAIWLTYYIGVHVWLQVACSGDFVCR